MRSLWRRRRTVAASGPDQAPQQHYSALGWIMSPGGAHAVAPAHVNVVAGQLSLTSNTPTAPGSSTQPLARLGLVETRGSEVDLYFVEDDHTLSPSWLRFPDVSQAEAFLTEILAGYQSATAQPFPTGWLQRGPASNPP